MRKDLLIALLLTALVSCDKKSGGGGEPLVNPAVSISDVRQPEGNSGTTQFEFSVSMDKASDKPVTVTYSTQNGTASSSDFTALTNQAVTLQPGETSKKVVVAVSGDVQPEEDETFSVIISTVSGGSIKKAAGAGTIVNDDVAGNNLVWSEEFNGSTLDLNAWSHENGDGCPNVCGWGNNELEYYTDRPENLRLENGHLIIEARKEEHSGKSYTSSKIVTRGKKTFKWGRIEIRAKLPKGKGIWPALWMMPQNSVYGGWPRSGEIDIMELIGHEPNKVHGTVHYGPGPGSIHTGAAYTLPSGTFNDGFHVFSLEWSKDLLKWYVDGNLFYTHTKADVGTNTYPFNEEFYMIINLAVGGNWPGNPDATTTFPQQLVVDYVRVYQ